MQQDRRPAGVSAHPAVAFRYQVVGIVFGAIAAVAFARVFMAAYPVLSLDQTTMPQEAQPHEWSSTMTYKFVGALRSLTNDRPYQRTAIWIGIGIGFVTEVLRKLILAAAGWRRFVASGRLGFAIDFALDAIVLPSPYASSFGGFLNLVTSSWFAAGGVLSSLVNSLHRGRGQNGDSAGELPSDMSTTSLVGGGLIAGDALAALGLGIAGLLVSVGG